MHMDMHMHMDMDMDMHMHMHTRTRTCTCTFTCTWTWPCTCTCTHNTHTHTHREGKRDECPSRAEFGNWTTFVVRKVEPTSRRRTRQGAKDEQCLRCGSTDDGGEEDSRRMLLCDTCDAGWHMYCLPVPLTSVPEGDWHCPDCFTPDESDVACRFCNSTNSGTGKGAMLLCESCGAGWHMSCLPDPLTKVPDGDWHCPHCTDGKEES